MTYPRRPVLAALCVLLLITTLALWVASYRRGDGDDRCGARLAVGADCSRAGVARYADDDRLRPRVRRVGPIHRAIVGTRSATVGPRRPALGDAAGPSGGPVVVLAGAEGGGGV